MSSTPRECTLHPRGGQPVAARAWGPEDGAPVLCLHGWLDNAASFDRLAPLLPGIHLVAVDLPGHGLSEHRPAAAAYDFVAWIVDVFDLADALGWERFAILGHSLGGMIGLCAAGTMPTRVCRAVSIDSLGPLTREANETPRALGEALKQRRAYLTRLPRPLADLDAAARFMRVANPALDLEASRILAARGTRPTPEGLVWRADPRLRTGSLLRLTEAQVQAFFAEVTCPVLLIKPRQGWPEVDAQIQRRLSCLADARVEAVDGSHHAHLVNPHDVAPAVSSFLVAE
jgi:pimeloyl-ACP methyl ester carboxylesterase